MNAKKLVKEANLIKLAIPEYRGKYKKCRTCTHAIEPLMIMVLVKDTCPKKHKFSSGYMSDKHTCEECEHFTERGETHGRTIQRLPQGMSDGK